MEMTFHRNRQISLIDYYKNLPEARVDDMRNISNDEDPVRFLSAAAQADVVFEEGLTVREVLICLIPWRNTMQKATGVDVEAWLKGAERARKPRGSRRRALASIDIFPEIRIHPKSKHAGKPGEMKFVPEKKTGLCRIVFPKALISDAYEMNVQWQCLAAYKKPIEDKLTGHIDTHCGVSAPTIADWINLPIVIKPTAKLIESQEPRHMSWKGPLLDRKNPLLTKFRRGGILEINHDFSSFGDVILGAFCRDFLMFPTPQRANAYAKNVRRTMKQTDREFRRYKSARRAGSA